MNFSALKTTMSRVLARLKTSRRKRGALGTLRVAAGEGAYLLRYRYREWRFDRSLGVNTRNTEGPGTRARIFNGIESEARHSVTGFGPTDPAVLVELLESLPIRHEDFAFVDIGSGKGRALLIASNWPFRQILGVELSAELDAVARRNLSDRRGRPPRCQDIRTVSADATTHPLPAGPVLLFLNNPFRQEGLERFLASVESSWRASPRPIFILYLIPRLASVFEKFALFQRVKSSRDYFFLYKTRDPEPPSEDAVPFDSSQARSGGQRM
jgi:SAM-dependent methyltransferase